MRRAIHVIAAFLVAAAPAAALELDALAVARAGCSLVDRVERSPAAPLAPAWVLGVDARRIDVEAGIEAVAVRGGFTPGTWTIGAACDHVRSPVHGDTGLGAALGRRVGVATLGAGVELRRLRFASGATLSRLRVRVGAGLRHGGVAAAAVALLPSAGEPPRLGAGLRVHIASGFATELELERRPGNAPAARCALGLVGRAAEAWCGYDIASGAAATGAAVRAGGVRIAVAVRVHPELGWSPAWSCEWRR